MTDNLRALDSSKVSPIHSLRVLSKIIRVMFGLLPKMASIFLIENKEESLKVVLDHIMVAKLPEKDIQEQWK